MRNKEKKREWEDKGSRKIKGPEEGKLKKARVTNPLLSIFNGILVDLACPPNLSAFYNFGSILGFMLGTQIITGLFLAMHYRCDSELAYFSISHILRDVHSGWLIRSLHANGASFFFLALYAHIGRGIYFGSYVFSSLWFVGIILLLLVMAASFLGYVLP